MAKKTSGKLKEMREKSQKRRLDKAKEFADELVKNLQDKVVSVVVWGSTTRGEHSAKSDIDTFVLLDDTRLEHDVPFEIQEKIRYKVIELARKIDKRITLQYFSFLTDFWDALRQGEPLTIDVLRLGIPVYDSGVFWPAKRLLMRGRIYSSREAVFKRMQLADMTLKKIEADLFRSMPFHLEQAITSAGQAPVMLMGRTPPGKFDMPKIVEEMFVKPGLLDKKYVKIANEIKELADKAEKGEGKITGELVEDAIKKGREFFKGIDTLIRDLGEQQKVRGLVEDYKVFLRASVAALKSKKIDPPEKKEDLPKIVSKEFKLDEQQIKLFERWDTVLSKVKEKKEKDIPEKEMYEIRADTKYFIAALGQKIGPLLGMPKGAKDEKTLDKVSGTHLDSQEVDGVSLDRKSGSKKTSKSKK